MLEVLLLVIGVLVGIGGDELWGVAKQRLNTRRRRRLTKSFLEENDTVKHAHNLVRIYTSTGRGESLYSPTTIHSSEMVPVLPASNSAWVGRVHSSLDLPFKIVSTRRDKFPHDAALITRLKREGLRIWDGSVLYSKNNGEIGDTLPVGVCNYFGYINLGDRVLHESSEIAGAKPLLEHLSSFENALSGQIAPVVIAGAATCVFETDRGPVIALQRRSQKVVNARGLMGVAPIFGFELNEVAGQRSRFGVVVYNVLKEILEEFVNEKSARHANDSPKVGNPDSLFETQHGRRLLDELQSDRLRIYCTGAAIDVTDGSLFLSLLVHFTSPSYTEYLRDASVGSWESVGGDGAPKILFKSLFSPEVESMMSIDEMIATSIYSLDRARATIRSFTA